MTREELLARIDEHETLAGAWQQVITREAVIDETDDPWSSGVIEAGQMPKAPGKRHDRRHKREAHRNEAEVYVERIEERCQLARQAIDNGDGDSALTHEREAAQNRQLVEPMIAEIKKRAESKETGAQGGANSWKPRKK